MTNAPAGQVSKRVAPRFEVLYQGQELEVRSKATPNTCG